MDDCVMTTQGNGLSRGGGAEWAGTAWAGTELPLWLGEDKTSTCLSSQFSPFVTSVCRS